MIGYVARRLLAIVPVLLVVAGVVFLVLRLTPGDPAAVIAGNNASADDVARIREHLGLARPLPMQFWIWISNASQGDLGHSYYLDKPVAALVAQRIGPSLSLAAGTLLLSVAIALPLGTLAAWRRGGGLDRMLSVLAVAGFSVPAFVIGYALVYVFAIRLQWLPVQGYRRLFGEAGEQGSAIVNLVAWARQLVLPWLTLAAVYVALIARVTRASVAEALGEDYVRTARAKGLGEPAVLLRHALANAALPIVTVIGTGVALLIGGVVVTETVFAIPGLGSLVVEAVLNRDFPVVQGVVLCFSVLYVLVNLAVDLSYLGLDPRVRY